MEKVQKYYNKCVLSKLDTTLPSNVKDIDDVYKHYKNLYCQKGGMVVMDVPHNAVMGPLGYLGDPYYDDYPLMYPSPLPSPPPPPPYMIITQQEDTFFTDLQNKINTLTQDEKVKISMKTDVENMKLKYESGNMTPKDMFKYTMALAIKVNNSEPDLNELQNI